MPQSQPGLKLCCTVEISRVNRLAVLGSLFLEILKCARSPWIALWTREARPVSFPRLRTRADPLHYHYAFAQGEQGAPSLRKRRDRNRLKLGNRTSTPRDFPPAFS